MQPMPNRMGLGMRPTPFGQGPSMSALAQQQHIQPQFVNAQAVRTTTLFVGSISGGITDQHLNEMLGACGPLNSFKRLITPANKPQGFGFAEFQDPDAAVRALKLLNGVELPALEDGCANKKLLVKADEKTTAFINAYQAQRAPTDTDNIKAEEAKAKIDEVVTTLNKVSANSGEGGSEKERYIIPPHLHDLQEAELPEAQRGLVISEIALFRERAAKREREKLRDERERGMAFGNTTAFNTPGRGNGVAAPSPKGPANAPSGPKERAWGRGQGQQQQTPPRQQGGYGSGAQGYNKPVGFVQSQGDTSGDSGKTDEQREQDRKDARARDENESFRDRERRYEPRERQRIVNLERAIQRERLQKEAEERDKIEMHSRLDIWDDDESDELFYTDRSRWRSARRRHLAQEDAADRASRDLEATEAEHLRRESEAFLARQMDEMRSLAEEQRKAGLLLDDGAPVKLNVSLAPAPVAKPGESAAPVPVFGQPEDEEEGVRKRKASLIKLDFSATESGEKARQRLEKIRDSVPTDKETLWKVKVRWDAVNEQLVDRKLEPVIKRKITEYLGELEDDDLIMFVVEHLKDKKGPQKLVEGLEPVLVEEAEEFVIALWRQVTFESMAYGEGLDSGKMLAI